ncbi:MAG: hypothetical protein MJB14_03350 [Spirochaetes bacterium]|nr:hypothetical protein [Spirochaetota bacterium]
MKQNLQPIVLNQITSTPTLDKILIRMGYNKHKTKISKQEISKIESVITRYQYLVHSRAVYLRTTVQIEDHSIKFANIHWESHKLAKFLAHCTELILIAVTAGDDLIIQRDKAIEEQQNYQAVVIDALASETVEAAAEWLQHYFQQLLLREHKIPTQRRYSPGYGDFSLKAQQDFYHLLNLDQFALKLTSHYLFIPEKTITAIIGIHQ